MHAGTLRRCHSHACALTRLCTRRLRCAVPALAAQWSEGCSAPGSRSRNGSVSLSYAASAGWARASCCLRAQVLRSPCTDCLQPPRHLEATRCNQPAKPAPSSDVKRGSEGGQPPVLPPFPTAARAGNRRRCVREPASTEGNVTPCCGCGAWCCVCCGSRGVLRLECVQSGHSTPLPDPHPAPTDAAAITALCIFTKLT